MARAGSIAVWSWKQTAGYGTMFHGEAVAIGMGYAAMLSVHQGMLSQQECDRLVALLGKLGMTVGAREQPWEQLRDAMASDKKARELVPRFVLAEKLGSAIINCEVPEDVLARIFLEITCLV